VRKKDLEKSCMLTMAIEKKMNMKKNYTKGLNVSIFIVELPKKIHELTK
jgi:hypothetical protein